MHRLRVRVRRLAVEEVGPTIVEGAAALGAVVVNGGTGCGPARRR